MKAKKFILSGISEVDFSIHYVDIDVSSPLNQKEPHIHKDCEIYLNLSGDVAFEVEGRIYPVSRGSVIITRPYEYHHCIIRSNAFHCHYWITFSGEYGMDFLKMFFRREKGKDNLIILKDKELAEMCGVLEELLAEEKDSLHRHINFLRIFEILGRGSRMVDVGSVEGMPEDVMKAVKYMEEHLTEDITIRMLAQVGSVGINTLERHFKECFHMAPFAVLRRKRLIHSMSCLRSGDSVWEAAVKSGFSDYSNYIQQFRKEFKITPLQYKKSII